MSRYDRNLLFMIGMIGICFSYNQSNTSKIDRQEHQKIYKSTLFLQRCMNKKCVGI